MDRQALKKMVENPPSRWSGLVQEVSGIIFQSEGVYSGNILFQNYFILYKLMNIFYPAESP